MLVVWVFALGSGIVNACIVAPGLPTSVPAITHDHEGAIAASPHGHATDAVGHVRHPSPGATDACAKFCADESAGAPTKTQRPDFVDLACWALAPMPPPLLAALAQPAGALRADSTPWRAKVPIPIAFLRLTL